MDIVTGISALSKAMEGIRALREIDREFDQAALKSEMADIYGALADAKIALSDSRELLHEKDEEIARLNKIIEAQSSGEACPMCGAGRMKMIAEVPDPVFGDMGVLQQTFQCQEPECGHERKIQHDPAKAQGRR
jgi:hypothetical protein